MTDAPRRTWKAYAVLGLLAGLLILGYALRQIFTPVLAAFALAVLFNPAAAWLERRGVRRTTGILVLYATVSLAAAAAFALAIPLVSREVSSLYQMTFRGEPYVDLNANGSYDPDEPLARDLNGNGRRDRAYLERVEDFGRRALRQWNARHPEQAIHPDALLGRVREAVESNLSEVTGGVAAALNRLVAVAVSGVQGIFLVLSYLLLVPIYLFVFLKHFDRFHPAALRFCPAAERERLARVLRRLNAAIAGFFRGQMLCSAAKGLLVAVGLTIVGTPYGFLLGLVYGILSVVPYVGVLTAFPLIEIVTVLDAGGVDVSKVVGAIVVVGIAEAVEGFVLVPFIFGGETGLHPIVLLLSLFIFGELFGFFGLLAAVPLAAAAKILTEEYILPTVREVVEEGRPPPEANPNSQPPNPK